MRLYQTWQNMSLLCANRLLLIIDFVLLITTIFMCLTELCVGVLIVLYVCLCVCVCVCLFVCVHVCLRIPVHVNRGHLNNQDVIYVRH